jgi:hypothetical protein
MKEERRTQKEALMAMAPAAAGWSRFKSGFWGEMNDHSGNTAMGSVSKILTLPIAALIGLYEGSANAWSGGLSTSDPDPTGEKKRRLDEAMVARRNGNLMHWNALKEIEQTTSISGIASRGGSGSLANVGGYFFGDQANQSLLSESKKTTYLLEQIEEKTSKIADGFNPEAP